MRYAFITSTGRTGTEFFSYLFSEVTENSWSLHEPKPAFCRRGYAFLSRKPGWYDKMYFGLSRRMYNIGKDKDWYVEPNHHLFSSIPMIREAFPNAIIIHIVRDGRPVVRSWLNRNKYITRDLFTASHVPNDPAQKVWQEWNPIQKLSWYWKTVNETAEQAKPDLIVRFEDIFQKENSAIFDILDAMPGIRYDAENVRKALTRRVNSNRKEFFPKFEHWPSEWKNQFWEIAEGEMSKHGYE